MNIPDELQKLKTDLLCMGYSIRKYPNDEEQHYINGTFYLNFEKKGKSVYIMFDV